MRNILLVDDDRDQLVVRQLILERSGHKVTAAADAAQARAAFTSTHPDTVIMDLRVPNAADGLKLIRELHAESPATEILVLSGAPQDIAGTPEESMVRHVLAKPVRSQKLLGWLAKLAVLALMLSLRCDAQTQQIFPFLVQKEAEIVVDLELNAPDTDWGKPGKEAVVAAVALDDQPQQCVTVFLGSTRHIYPIFLGRLAAGQHRLEVKRHPVYSAPDTELRVRSVAFKPVVDNPILQHAPILYARANTVGKFTDVPMIVYAEHLKESGADLLQYTVIFSNEDGGTSTRALMARWGRTTDIEYCYRAFLHPDGSLLRATIQTKGHQEVEFHGRREGAHPFLIPITDNNTFGDEGTSPVQYRIVPVLTDLTKHSREQLMDEKPFAYFVMARELEREGKLRPYGTVDGMKISDPRNYLYIEALVANEQSGLSAMVRLRGSSRWQTANLGREDYAIERGGWIRTTVELPPGTKPDEVEEIGFACVVVRDNGRLPVAGKCKVEEISKAFFLDHDFRPMDSFFSAKPAVSLGTGEIWSTRVEP